MEKPSKKRLLRKVLKVSAKLMQLRDSLDYLPDDDVLALAKKFCRYALVTGSKDFNRPNTFGVLENGFRKEGFANVTYLEAPGVGHALPPVKFLEQALEFLDQGKSAKAATK